ncbi:hypothetical protein HGRIS_007438 [Hohenbuehelia grisea]|uniref:Uncharacterized protein n=1 Tax=Hohenbuehelia grisea TaxID=104357 RepID=A0ABR3J684_9AGAR
MRSSRCQKLILLLCGFKACAALVNTTIDDKYGDPDTGAFITYSPAVSWNDGTNCTGCTAKFDGQQAYMQSWHDGTFATSAATNPTPGAILTATIPFTGSAVYVYCILGHTHEGPNTNTDMTFFLDGQQVGIFQKTPTGATNYDFNTLVYSNTSIPHGPHTLSLENGHLGNKSLVILDYVVYSHEEARKPSKTPIIVGAIIGPIVLILVVLAAVFFTRRYMRRKHGKPYPLDLSNELVLHRPKSPPQEQPMDPSWKVEPLRLDAAYRGSTQELLDHQTEFTPSTYVGSPTSHSYGLSSLATSAAQPLYSGTSPSSRKTEQMRLHNHSDIDEEPAPPAYSPSASR